MCHAFTNLKIINPVKCSTLDYIYFSQKEGGTPLHLRRRKVDDGDVLMVISLNFRPGGERGETKAKRVEFQRGSQRDIRFSCALQSFPLALCYKACAFYLETPALASRMEGEKKSKDE